MAVSRKPTAFVPIEEHAAAGEAGHHAASSRCSTPVNPEPDDGVSEVDALQQTLAPDRGSRELFQHPKVVSYLMEGPSPLPAFFWSGKASRLITRLWGLRCPAALCDIDVRYALQGIANYLTTYQSVLLCIGYWLFNADVETVLIWDFYEFMFHRNTFPKQRQIFESIKEKLPESQSIEKTITQWDNMLGLINKHVNDILTYLNYPLCICDDEQPHSSHTLKEIILLLEEKGKLTASETTQYALNAYQSLRVHDLMEKESTGPSQHPSLDSSHRIVLRSLRAGGIPNNPESRLAMEYREAMKYEKAYEDFNNLLKNGLPSDFAIEGNPVEGENREPHQFKEPSYLNLGKE